MYFDRREARFYFEMDDQGVCKTHNESENSIATVSVMNRQ